MSNTYNLIMEKIYLKINDNELPIYIAKTWKEKYKGLMHQKNINYGLIIPNCISIHTYFMLENIDIIFFNEFGTILYIYQNISPNKVIQINEDIRKTSVLELPKNTSKNFKIGDTLSFEFKDII